MATGVKQQQRRGTAAEWNTSNYVLDEGELGVTTDTGIIKIGDGVNGWNDLPAAFGSAYLPLLGKAADTELFDGIDSSGFWKTADASTAATADKLAKRTADGRILAANGTTGSEVVNYAQMSASIVTAKALSTIRTVTADFTLAAADVGGLVFVNGSAWATTVVCTIPDNATVPMAVGSVIKIRTTSSAQSPVSLSPAAGVSLAGQSWIAGEGSYLELVKNGTDSWVVLTASNSPGPMLRRRFKPGSDNSLTNAWIRLRLDGADEPTLKTNNFDSLGSGSQYNSATSLYKVFCRRAGYYHFDVQLGSDHNNLSGRLAMRVLINGTLQKFGGTSARYGPDITAGVTGYLPLSVNDEVEVEAYIDGGSGQVLADSPHSASFFGWAWHRPL